MNTEEQVLHPKKKRRGKYIVIIAIICALLLIVMGLRAHLWAKDDASRDLLEVVSLQSPLESVHKPKLTEVDGIKVSKRCADALKQMLVDCEAAGNKAYLERGYVSREQQKSEFEEHVAYLTSFGVSYEDAAAQAGEIVPYPGSDEHELGLSVDILDDSYRTMDIWQGSTTTNRWLHDNCWNYGFVVRYPDSKSDVTGKEYVPWHYRYVGVDAATQMHQLDLTLEEYLMWFYSEDALVIMEP